VKLLSIICSLFLCLPVLAAVEAPKVVQPAVTLVEPDVKSSNTSLKEIVLSKDNVAILDDVIEGESVSKVLTKLRELDAVNKSAYPIYLFLNTPGGSIQDGLELIEGVQGINRPVNTITLFAASMGWQTVQNLGQRYILSNGVLMSHKAKGGFSGEFGDGISQIDSRYALWMERILQLDKQTVKRTNGKQTLASYRAQYENEMWLTGSQAVARGYADELVSVRCSKDLNGTRESKVDFFGMTIILTFSECPIITAPLSVEVIIPSNKGTMTLTAFLAKGGVFQSKSDGYYAPDLYCTDPNMTLEKVRKAVEEERTNITNALENKKVIRGY
jgi:ATP-dependent Clp protease protease subunit